MSASRIVWLLLLGLAACAQDLTSLSLEDFLKVEVTSVDRTAQELWRSPAAVYVITQDDIRRSGLTSLPEVLRLAPGVSVAKLGSGDWAIGIRGFGAVYANKLLVMIDGRTIYTPVFSGTLWAEHMLMLEDIERIEVIRGQGASMWGANAVNGVINIITKSARDTKGGLVAGTVGTDHPGRGRFRYGDTLGKDGAWRMWGQYGRYGQPPVRDLAELPSWSSARSGARFDWSRGERDSFSVQSETQRSRARSPLVELAPGSKIFDVYPVGITSGFVMGSWDHETRSGAQSKLQVFFDKLHGEFGLVGADSHTLDSDWQISIPFKRHDVIAGAGLRSNWIETRGTPRFSFSPADATYLVASAFVQDEWTLLEDRLWLTLGAKLENVTRGGTSLQPTVRVMWTPSKRMAYWAAASHAVRTPAHLDYAAKIPAILQGVPFTVECIGNPSIQPEQVYGAEAGARFQFGRRWAFDAAGFEQRYFGLEATILQPLSQSDLAAIMSGKRVTLTALNSPAFSAKYSGFEVEARFEANHRWHLRGSVSKLFREQWLRPGYSPIGVFLMPDKAPLNQAALHSSWDLMRGWSADLALYWQGVTPDGTMPPRVRMDARVARKLGESGEVAFVAQDPFRPQQAPFVGPLQPDGMLTGGFETTFTWRF